MVANYPISIPNKMTPYITFHYFSWSFLRLKENGCHNVKNRLRDKKYIQKLSHALIYSKFPRRQSLLSPKNKIK